MALYDWLFIIFLIIISYVAYNEIKRKYPSRKLLFRIKTVSREIQLIIWILLLILYVWMGVDGIISTWGLDHEEPIKFFSNRIVRTSIMLVLVSLVNIFRAYKSGEIRSDGIATDNGFIEWKGIKEYNWIGERTEYSKELGDKNRTVMEYEKLEFILNKKRLFSNKDVKRVWKVNLNEKDKIEGLLREYVKQQKKEQ